MVLFIFTTAALLPAQNSLNSELALLHVRTALAAYHNNSVNEAAAIIQQAGPFARAYAGYFVVSGLIAQRQGLYGEAIERFEEALITGNSDNLFTRNQVIAWLLPLYYRAGRYQEAVSLYQVNSLVNDDSNALFYLLSLQRLGSSRLFEEADSLISLYPTNFSLYFALLNEAGFSGRYLANLRFLALNQPQVVSDEVTRSLMVAALRGVQNEDLRRELISLSQNWLRTDINFRNLSLLEGGLVPLLADDEEATSLFIEIDLLPEPPSFTEGSEVFILGRDRTLDGFADELGRLTLNEAVWHSYLNQSGRPHYSVNIVNGLITSINEKRGHNEILWEFISYPYVSRVTVSFPQLNQVGARRLVYTIVPGSITFAPPANHSLRADWAAVPVFNATTALPEQWQLLANSSQLDEYYGSFHFRSMRLLNGEVVTILEDSSGRGRFDYLLMVQDWQVQYARRDVNGTGNFNLFEYYRDGVWVGLAYFGDDREIAVYFEDWQTIPIKLWDFDRDGYIDAYYFEGPLGREFNLSANLLRPVTAAEILAWHRLGSLIP